MIGEIGELQRKRACNIIWNAARDHGFSPTLKAFDSEGRADIYWNSILGAAHFQYDYAVLEALFERLEQYEDADIYESLLWLGLENALFLRERDDRPVLAELRQSYAKEFLRLYATGETDRLYESLATAHFRRVLGQKPKLGAYEEKLLNELEFTAEMTEKEIVEQAEELLRRWFQIRADEKKKDRRRSPPALFARKKTSDNSRVKKFGIGFLEHPHSSYGGSSDGSREESEIKSKLTPEQLREFMTGKYGKSVFSPREISEIERSLCTGTHEGCNLHFTDGEVSKEIIVNAFEALQKQKEAKQIEKNRRYYQDHIRQNSTVIAKLSSEIRNSVLMYLQPADIKSGSGRFHAPDAWRASVLEDERIFLKTEQGDMGDLSVDILLDASTSQKNRQETVSSQGYIIAESLTRCGIPCRVMSFCSMTGYTVMHIFRDYHEREKNRNIFDYVSNGCNRDGLAVRAAHYLMQRSPCDHRILIILSDVKPNDVKWIRDGDRLIPYEQQAGLTDTALEVRRARADGIAVVCVFTGEDEDVPSAKTVYGRDFARIKSLDMLADTVGLLIKNQIKNL